METLRKTPLVFLLLIFLASCGPTREEISVTLDVLQETSQALRGTLEALSLTLTPEPTLPSTSTPIPLPTETPTPTPIPPFTFAVMADAEGVADGFARTVGQVASLDPDFVLFVGDLEGSGATLAELETMTAPLKEMGLFERTFLVRGNHDYYAQDSALTWQAYFKRSARPLPPGVTGYASLEAGSDQLNYSFEYGNSIFIGLDIPEITQVEQAQLDFAESRLADAEQRGIGQAFLFFHAAEYCVESFHCTCVAKGDWGCTPRAFAELANRHPILRATFHGHEHILGWVQMDASRVPTLERSYEQFLVSPAGAWSYNQYLYPERMDYTYLEMGTGRGFALVTVEGEGFTVALYKVGLSEPVWVKEFGKP